MGRHSRTSDEFGILFVCTGNVCRSALAEIVTRQMLSERLRAAAGDFAVASAGVRAAVGAPMHPQTRTELCTWGDRAWEDAGRHIARQLEPAMVEHADLILVAERQHRSTVLEASPLALDKTFCLREFARLLGSGDVSRLAAQPPSRARELVRAAHRARGTLPPVPAEQDAVPDPVAAPPEMHRVAAELIASAVEALVDLLAR